MHLLSLNNSVVCLSKNTICSCNIELFKKKMHNTCSLRLLCLLYFVDEKCLQSRLYWVDAKLHTISSSNIDGSDARIVLYSSRFVKHPFSITVFEVKYKGQSLQ